MASCRLQGCPLTVGWPTDSVLLFFHLGIRYRLHSFRQRVAGSPYI